MKTDIISFNLTQRGRKHTGKARAYETKTGAAKIARIINGPAVQERVKAGDMKGFLGHLPRQLANTPYPPECAVGPNGRMVYFEPAFRTTLLRAQPDGTIEHQAEFMDSPPGRIAFRQYQNRDGGFSAVIDDADPNGFYGFDYVAEPNFVFNRSWAPVMDSAIPGDGLDMDSASAMTEYNAMVLANDRMMAYLQSSSEALVKQLDSARQENIDLLGRLARLERKPTPYRDPEEWSAPFRVRGDAAERLLKDIESFDSVRLPRVVDPAASWQDGRISPEERTVRRLLGIF